MIRMILAIAVAGFAAVPAFAMDDMSCGDFTAMDAAGQAQAVAGMEEGTMATGGMMASADAGAMSPEETAVGLAAACAQHPEMMMGEAMGMLPQ